MTGPMGTTSRAQRWNCPKPHCAQHVELFVTPAEAPRCSGDATRSHRSTAMVLETTNQGATTMSTTTGTKTRKAAPDKECQCHAVPVDGKPGNYIACGRLTRGEFAPGHDAKLKSALIACAVAGIKYNGKDPHKVAADRGWSKFTDRAVAVAEERAAKRAAKAAAKKAPAKAPAKKAPAKKAPAKKAPAKRRTKKAALTPDGVLDGLTS